MEVIGKVTEDEDTHFDEKSRNLEEEKEKIKHRKEVPPHQGDMGRDIGDGLYEGDNESYTVK